jgi:RNA polymerase sigma-70 factor (ECF subfamily)
MCTHHREFGAMPELTQSTQPYYSFQPVLFAPSLCVPSAPAVRARGQDSQSSDDELLERFAAGQQAAADELLRRHQAAAFRVACRFLRNHADAQDVVQESFIKAWNRREQFRGGSFPAWLHRIIRNAAAEFFRRRCCAQTAEAEYAVNRPASEQSSAPDHLMEDQRLAIDSVLRAHADERMLAVYRLRVEKGLSYAEIANTLGCCRQSVGKAMNKVLAILRTHLPPLGYGSRDSPLPLRR